MSNELKHFGIKGMRWGVRRQIEASVPKSVKKPNKPKPMTAKRFVKRGIKRAVVNASFYAAHRFFKSTMFQNTLDHNLGYIKNYQTQHALRVIGKNMPKWSSIAFSAVSFGNYAGMMLDQQQMLKLAKRSRK